jgi:hypothetical protein
MKRKEAITQAAFDAMVAQAKEELTVAVNESVVANLRRSLPVVLTEAVPPIVESILSRHMDVFADRVQRLALNLVDTRAEKKAKAAMDAHLNELHAEAAGG